MVDDDVDEDDDVETAQMCDLGKTIFYCIQSCRGK